MDLLCLQKSFEVWRKKIAFFRIVNEYIGGKDLLALKLTERAGLVHNGIDVRLPYRKDLPNSMLYFWISSL
jgi:hypothetical protein